MKKDEMTAYLLRLSTAKLQLMEHLLGLTKEQGEALEPEAVERMEKLLQQKQEIMDKIDLLDREFLEKYNKLKEALGIQILQQVNSEELPGLKELQEKIQQIVGIVEEIQGLDQLHKDQMQKSIAKTKNNLKNLKTGQKAISGYQSPYRESHALFFDKKK